jgi:xanthine dehydrogenase accessory factor
MAASTCILTSEPDSTDPEGPAPRPDLRDVALQLRLLLSLGVSFAVATVLSVTGPAVRRAGTVVVVTESGQTIGFRPEGCLDGAIRDLAAEVVSTGQDRLEQLEIDAEAASYIGLSGRVSLQVHITRVQAGDAAFGNALRHLDSGDAHVVVIGTRGLTGCAVVGQARTAGNLGWPDLPPPVIDDARSLLETHQTAWRSYGPGGDRGGTATQVWMQPYPRM